MLEKDAADIKREVNNNGCLIVIMLLLTWVMCGLILSGVYETNERLKAVNERTDP